MQPEAHFRSVFLEDMKIRILGVKCKSFHLLHRESWILTVACSTYVGSGGRTGQVHLLLFVDERVTDVLSEANFRPIVC